MNDPVELLFEIPVNEWWTQNRRGPWQAKFVCTSAVRRRALVTARSERRRLFGDQRPVYERCHVTALIGFQTQGRADPDNASPMVKAIIDAMTEAGWWRDDDSTHITGIDYQRDKNSRRKGWYTIRIRIQEQRAS